MQMFVLDISQLQITHLFFVFIKTKTSRGSWTCSTGLGSLIPGQSEALPPSGSSLFSILTWRPYLSVSVSDDRNTHVHTHRQYIHIYMCVCVVFQSPSAGREEGPRGLCGLADQEADV